MYRSKLLFLFLFLLPVPGLVAQKPAEKVNEYAKLDAKALQLPDSLMSGTDKIAGYINTHFSSTAERSRAIFIWVANNIQYDVDNMFAINFYEEPGEKIAKVLRTRKGICENYAALFTDICGKAGIPSYVVEGYTKQKGFVDYIPHAWCAARLDSGWFLFDPTWGSGYISNGKFVRKINNDYFKARPEVFIKDHIPFDYLWEFLYYPVTNQEFYEGRTAPDKSKAYFNYPDSIRAYEALDSSGQEMAAAVRVEAGGVRNSLIFDRLRHLKLEIENHRRQEEVNRQNAAVYAYNSALAEYNAGVNQFNVFINYYNKQFKPERPDAGIRAMIDSADHSLRSARSGTGAIHATGAQIQTSITALNKAIEDALAQVTEREEWLTKYFSKGKGGRRSMFSKYSFFGIPLN
jgi:hypothetical protein